MQPSCEAASTMAVETPAAGNVLSPYWVSWTSCPVPRGSPPPPLAAWAWQGAARAESGCEERRRVGQREVGSCRDHWGQEEIPGPSPSAPPLPPPPSSAPLFAPPLPPPAAVRPPSAPPSCSTSKNKIQNYTHTYKYTYIHTRTHTHKINRFKKTLICS